MSFDLKIKDGDIAISNTGDLQKVEGSEKLTQDILKIISTPIGGNTFFPWYGSPIEQSLVGTSYDTSFISAVASSQLRTTLERLQALQKDQMKSYQVVTPAEQLAAIQNVSVERNQVDPRFFRVVITVINKAFQSKQTSLLVSL